MDLNVVDIQDGRRCLIIGDSLVAGQGAKDNNGWAQQFAKRISADIVGIRGATSGDIIGYLPEKAYEQVIVQIGTNDARYRHAKKATETSLDQYHSNLTNIVQHFRSLNHEVQFAFMDLLLVDERKTVLYKVDRSYFDKNFQRVRKALRTFCDANKLGFVQLSDLEQNKEDFQDGLHPSQRIHDAVMNSVAHAYEIRANRPTIDCL